MNITIKTIPHDKQAYPTCGDWRFDKDGNLNIFISDMKNWKYEVLVAIHELCEVVLCKDRGITTEEVDAFDIAFEKKREERIKEAKSKYVQRSTTGGRRGESMKLRSRIDEINSEEPGSQPDAPYFKEHLVASIVEKIMMNELDVDLDKYDKAVTSL